MAEPAWFSFLPITAAIMISVALSADNLQFELGGKGCSPNKYINATAFTDNLDSVLQSLLSNLSYDGFGTSQSIAGKSDPVYGLAVCRKYLSARECSECVTAAETQLKEYCPGSNGGRIYLDGCFVRYQNTSFYGQAVDPGVSSYCASTNASDTPYIFPDRVEALLAQLIMKALESNAGYSVLSFDGLYGVAQCWPSLTNDSCQACLTEAKAQLIDCGLQREGRDENFRSRGNFGQVFFDYKVLRDSTGNFDRNNMLGKGGFGEVYKGRIPDGRDVAVKKLNGRHETAQAAEEFLTEVKLLANVRHRNLVRLLGCCTRGHERLLVYEFMSNNSLHKHLFGDIRNPLSWENRLNIIVGTARGLAYLHEDSSVRIIHRDIKCGNILLDDRFHPKIADFGLARLFPEGETHVSTRIVGTVGYTAPEYAVHGQLTEKADVYSYGIVVLEIVSGRKCVDATLPAPTQLLLEWAWNQYKHDQVLDIVDPTLEGKYPREQALRVITIALLCTQGSWALRPAMSLVGLMLTNISEIPSQPTQPACIDAAAGRPANLTPTSASATSVAAPSQGSHGSITVSLLPR